MPGNYGLGHFISIIAEDGDDRKWYAERIYSMKFQYTEEEDEPAQSAEKVGVLPAHEFVTRALWDVPILQEAEWLPESPRESRRSRRLQ
jgi:hypothetical protein